MRRIAIVQLGEGSDTMLVQVLIESLHKPLAEEWKCPYHNGRMCLRLYQLELPEGL